LRLFGRSAPSDASHSSCAIQKLLGCGVVMGR
jgi:hypothetical protein